MSEVILKGFLINEEHLREEYFSKEPLSFPVNDNELEQFIQEQELSGEKAWVVGGFLSNHEGIIKILDDVENLEEINYLAGRMKELNYTERSILDAILEDPFSLPESGITGLINLTYNLKDYELFPEVIDEEELGNFYIKRSGEYDIRTIQELLPFIDYDAYGHRLHDDLQGKFTEAGYLIVKEDSWEKVYHGMIAEIPKEFRLTKDHPMDAERGSILKSRLRVLVVEPDKEPYPKEIESGYRSLQKEVGGTVQCIYPFDDAVGLLMNDDGKLIGLPLNRALYDVDGQIYDIIAGNFLVTGLSEGDFASLSSELMEKYAALYKHPQVFLMVNDEIKAIPSPDRSVTSEQMQLYGYDWEGMSPLRERQADKLFQAGCKVFCLYPDGTESAVTVQKEIQAHTENGGLFGIEKGSWYLFCEKNPLSKVEELLEDDYGMIDGIINNGGKNRTSPLDGKMSVVEKLKQKKDAVIHMGNAQTRKEKSNDMDLS